MAHTPKREPSERDGVRAERVGAALPGPTHPSNETLSARRCPPSRCGRGRGRGRLAVHPCRPPHQPGATLPTSSAAVSSVGRRCLASHCGLVWPQEAATAPAGLRRPRRDLQRGHHTGRSDASALSSWVFAVTLAPKHHTTKSYALGAEHSRRAGVPSGARSGRKDRGSAATTAERQPALPPSAAPAGRPPDAAPERRCGGRGPDPLPEGDRRGVGYLSSAADAQTTDTGVQPLALRGTFLARLCLRGLHLRQPGPPRCRLTPLPRRRSGPPGAGGLTAAKRING